MFAIFYWSQSFTPTIPHNTTQYHTIPPPITHWDWGVARSSLLHLHFLVAAHHVDVSVLDLGFDPLGDEVILLGSDLGHQKSLLGSLPLESLAIHLPGHTRWHNRLPEVGGVVVVLLCVCISPVFLLTDDLEGHVGVGSCKCLYEVSPPGRDSH